MKPILCAGLVSGDLRLEWPKASAREFHQKQKVVPNRKALRAIQSLWRACADCFRSQLRRIGFGQPRQARPRQSCANIP
jgi:hypothetical protein